MNRSRVKRVCLKHFQQYRKIKKKRKTNFYNMDFYFGGGSYFTFSYLASKGSKSKVLSVVTMGKVLCIMLGTKFCGSYIQLISRHIDLNFFKL